MSDRPRPLQRSAEGREAARLTVRRAIPADLSALLSLYEQLHPGDAGADRARAVPALREILANPNMSLLVAETEQVVGTVTLVIVPNLTHNAQPWAQVENMVTDATVRGSGAGRALIDECLRIAREANCYKVQLQSGNHRATAENDAHGFYRHLGFEPSSTGFRYYFGR
ncbi:MAG: GNAT family N-acetyltransferase [bacterium]